MIHHTFVAHMHVTRRIKHQVTLLSYIGFPHAYPKGSELTKVLDKSQMTKATLCNFSS